MKKVAVQNFHGPIQVFVIHQNFQVSFTNVGKNHWEFKLFEMHYFILFLFIFFYKFALLNKCKQNCEKMFSQKLRALGLPHGAAWERAGRIPALWGRTCGSHGCPGTGYSACAWSYRPRVSAMSETHTHAHIKKKNRMKNSCLLYCQSAFILANRCAHQM